MFPRTVMTVWMSVLFACAALASDKPVSDTQNFSLPAELTVQGNAYITTGLIPPRVVNQLFGKAIARSFAVVQVIVSNRSDQAALVLHGLSIDYSAWPLGGCAPSPPPTGHEAPPANAPPSPAPTGDDPLGNALDSHRVAARRCEVSTVELRAVRQVAQNGQISYWRNTVSRYLRAIGDVGGGLTVAAGLGPVLPRAVAGFSTGAVTAFEFAFPDKTVNQINLLNDTGYAVNTVVPKQSSVSVFAFFPIQRFLGSFLMKYYLTEPAIFFSPQSFLLDDKYAPFFKALLTHFGTPPAPGTAKDAILNIQANKELRDLLKQVTLDHVRVIAQGLYVVNVEEVAAEGSPPKFDGNDEDNFAKAGTVYGQIRGRYMNGGVPILQDADKLGVKAERVDQGSDENVLQIKLTLTKPIPAQTLSFTVKKEKKGAADLVSKPQTYQITYSSSLLPEISDALAPAKTGAALDLKGKNIYDWKDVDKRLKVVLRKKDKSGSEIEVPSDNVVWVSSAEVTAILPAAVGAGDWQILLKAGGAAGPARDLKVE
jgi:hypothetical protein